jgi:hypothetical protein
MAGLRITRVPPDADTSIETAAVAVLWVGLVESVTSIVKLDVPVPVGVPLITPVDATRDSPAGSDPELIDQLYGVMPPVAVNVVLYAVPCVAPGRPVLVTVKVAAANTSSETAAVAVLLSASVTANVKSLIPVPVGVPEISEGPSFFRMSPAGRVPELSEKLYGLTPPVAVRIVV